MLKYFFLKTKSTLKIISKSKYLFMEKMPTCGKGQMLTQQETGKCFKSLLVDCRLSHHAQTGWPAGLTKKTPKAYKKWPKRFARTVFTRKWENPFLKLPNNLVYSQCEHIWGNLATLANFRSLLQTFGGIRQNIEPTLANFHCCKWSNIEKII